VAYLQVLWHFKYLQLKKKLEDGFPGCLDICSKGTHQVTGFFEVFVAGKPVHSKKGGDGYMDMESKFLKLVAAIKAALAQGIFPTQGSNPGLLHCRQRLYHLSHQ
uniref:Selenoprotein W n=1 Tax=Bos indicus x Bos taurus TaxID=30522 RepID=A0A4W2D4M6_BOBOX